MLTIKQVDKAIREGKPVCLEFHNGDKGTVVIISRDRRHFVTATGGKFHRDDVKTVSTL